MGINLIQSTAVITHSNKHRAHHWWVLFSLIWKQTSFETMQNTWKLNNIGKSIVTIKSQGRNEMQLLREEHCGPYAWEVWSVSRLDTTRGVGDCSGSQSWSVSYRGNTDSTSSSQLICSDQGSMKNSTCGTPPESMGWSLEALLEGNSAVCIQDKLWHPQQIHTLKQCCAHFSLHCSKQSLNNHGASFQLHPLRWEI